MDIKELVSFKLSDAVSFHNELNPRLWNGQHLRPEVEKQLKEVANDFLEELGINGLDVKDVTISGSNAAYSYTPNSDVDLHILVDMNKLSNDDIYRELFQAKKTIYNDTHDITIHGVPVEVYVQDSNEKVVSLGEYSILDNKWLQFPSKRRANLNQNLTRHKYEKLLKLIEYALASKDIKKVNHLLKTIRRYRRAGLDKGGEFSPENLAYKVLRKQGYIDELYRIRDNLHSKSLSIENMYATEDESFLNKRTPSVEQLVIKYKVPKRDILIQLAKGIRVEMEHTNDEKTAREIALDHLGEDPRYYTKLQKAQLEESLNYEDGDCPIFAIALHRLSKLPLMALIEYDEELGSTVLIHAYVKLDDEWRIDYTGETTVSFMLRKYPNNGNAEEVEITEKDLIDLGYGKTKCPTLSQVLPHAKEVLDDIDTLNESASGYIPSKKEINDPRFKTALTVDIKPDTMKINAKKLGSTISRAGIPPTLKANGKF